MKSPRVVRPFVLAAFLSVAAWLLCGTPALAATVQVSTSADENGTGAACSLREAVVAINAGSNGTGGCVASGVYGTNDQIAFAAGTDGVPILLTNGQIIVTSNLQIVGNGATSTIVDGQRGTFSATRVLQVNGGIIVGISGLTIRNGSAGNIGGGIFNNGTLSLMNSTLSGNLASGSGGGGIFNGGTLSVTNSTLSGNSANPVGFGGGIYNQDTLSVTNSTLSDNSARGSGGGIFSSGGFISAALSVTNSTLSGNSAGFDGGGIFSDGTLSVTNSTLSGNSASGSGGGIEEFIGTATLRASVLDTGTSGTNCGGNITSLGSNVADDTSCGLAATGDQQVANGAILLGALMDHGGPTQTHALLAGSPAIDAVQGLCTSDGLASGTTIVTDQRGLPRPTGARCDAGAAEWRPGTLSFSLPAFTVGEGDGNAVITVTRTGASDGSVSATVTTANGTAIAPGDYTVSTPTVSFADGNTASKTVSIAITDDALHEPNETVLMTLGSPTGGAAIGGQSSAVVTIIDNDPTPFISIANVSVAEGNAGQTPATFTVGLTNPSTQQITVGYATANGTAMANSDYTAASGTLTFAPGVTSQPVAVPILGDTLFEPDETFTVTLSNPTNATLGNAQALGTITNDDVVVACTPRPRVTSSLQAGGGALAVRVEATPLNTPQNNPLHSLTFTRLDNATVTFNGQAVAGGQTVTLPPGTFLADFTVRRGAVGQAATVFLTVVDNCGAWPTFVGGGTSAGF